MILKASQWLSVVKVADIMQKLFDMPEESMQVEVTKSGTTIKGESLEAEVVLTIKRKEQNNG